MTKTTFQEIRKEAHRLLRKLKRNWLYDDRLKDYIFIVPESYRQIFQEQINIWDTGQSLKELSTFLGVTAVFDSGTDVLRLIKKIDWNR